MSLSLRTQRSLQALVLAGLGLFLLQQIWTGTLYWYINQRFMLLILLAAIGLLALARVVLPSPRAKAEAADPHEHDHEHSEGEAHGHDHDENKAAPVWGLLFLALPLVLGLLVPARPLGTAAIANKGINTTAPLTAGSSAPVQLDLASTDRNVLDWVRAFNYASDPATYTGQPADVIGFVYHAAGLPDGQFLVSRFAVTCCSADAMAIGLLVDWPDSATLENNSWIRVQGPMAVGSFSGRPTPLIEADSLEGVAAPDQPYLYP
jgi:putative membrane protein